MRSRERLIEVLDSVNCQVVTQYEWSTCMITASALKYNVTVNVAAALRARLTSPLWIESPHIRELLTEGLAILEADKLTGCSA